MSNALMSTYNRLPVSFRRGEGAWLWDDQGNKYLDALSGIAVCGLGHAHPRVSQAICEQARQLLHTSNLFRIATQENAASQLSRLANMDKVFFCNSGAEANESAIKLARLYGHNRKIALPSIVVAENSFHGRTMATLTASGNRKVQAGFEPLVQGFVRVEYDDISALRTIAEHNKNVVAVLIEPIQGEGGINLPGADYLRQVRSLCDEYDWLMMLDEVQTGLGRTGAWFAFQHHGIIPDVLALAKGLGNGVPVGACLASGEAAAVFTPGSHASTFGGNPLASSTVLAVLETMQTENLVDRAAVLGTSMMKALSSKLAGIPQVKAIRGRGLMLGIELADPCADLTTMALARGLLINVTAERVVRLLPPLIISDDEAMLIVDGVVDLLKNFYH